MNPEGWVFLFGGQGAQKAGMGADLARAFPDSGYYRAPFLSEEELELLLDPDFEGIHRTDYAQLALTIFGLTVTELLEARGFSPSASLGLSAGEFPALAAASVYSPQQIISIIRERASLMSRRLRARREEGFDDGMLAVVGLIQETVESLFTDLTGLSLANVNAPTQLTVSGSREELETLRQRIHDAGARKALFLEVEGAFHSPVFNPEVSRLRQVLLSHEAAPPQAVIPLNLLGEPAVETEDASGRCRLFADLMSRQMAEPTRLDDSFTYLLERGFTHFVEISPRPVLVPLLRRRASGLTLCQISDLGSLHAFMDQAGA